MEMLREDKWQEELDTIAVPYLEKRKEDRSLQGLRAVLYHADNAKGSVVVSHGFSEGIYKWLEFAYYLTREGYDVTLFDFPGHGDSYATLESNDRVHITRFDEYVDALEKIVDGVRDDIPLYLIGHSMGGAVITRYIEEGRNKRAAKAVLSSPMYKVNTDPVPEHIAHRIAYWFTKLGHGEEFVAGQGPFNPDKKNFEGSGTTSMPRYMYNHETRSRHTEHQKTGSSYNAMLEGIKAAKLSRRNIEKVDIPTLLFVAEHDTFVDTRAYDRLMPNDKIRIVKTKGTKHEVWNSTPEVAGPIYDQIFEFLEK